MLTMKRTVCLFICLFTIISCQLPASAQTPLAATAEIMDGIINTDVAAYSINVTDSGSVLAYAARTVLPPLLSKLEYSLGSSKITGNRAAVDIAVTAADTEDIILSAARQAAGLAVISRLFGVEADIGEFVLARVEKALNDENLTTISTNATVYLIRGGDGKWKLDLSEEKNLRFFEALTGGAVELEETVKLLMAGSE